MTRNVIVIGAGLAGLSAAIHARRNGYGATVFEHAAVPGGVLAAWTRKGYLFDGGMHWFMGAREGDPYFDTYRQVGILPGIRLIPVDRYIRVEDEGGRERIDVTGDLERLEADLVRASPADANKVAMLMACARAFRGNVAIGGGMDKPPEMQTVLDRIRFFWRLRKVLKYFGGSFGGPLRDFGKSFEDPLVGGIVGSLFFPEVPVWFMGWILAQLSEGKLAMPADGSLAVARAMEKKLLDDGGEVHYRSTVAKILVERGHAVGVRLEDGTEHRADAVISAADGRSVLFDMLDGKYLPPMLEKAYGSWGIFRPLFVVHWGLMNPLEGYAPTWTVRLETPLSVGGLDNPFLLLRTFNYGAFVPEAGKASLQASVETTWEHWAELRKDRARYDEEKERVAELLRQRLVRWVPALADGVAVTDVATPWTTWRYTRNDRGAYEGFLPEPAALMSSLPRRLPGLRSFYMAGQWTIPGGGVPTSILTGQHAVQLLCRDDRRTYRKG
jgi:phytoene dehydrogenase-like protein